MSDDADHHLLVELEEQRARRLALEEELAAIEDTWFHRPVEVRYVNVPVYRAPMPPKIVKVKGPERIRYVEKIVEVPGTPGVILVPDPERRGFFGRIGDWIDRVTGL